MQSIKVVVVGDGAVGKTTFLISFTLACFPQEYIPTIFDNYSAVYEFEGRKISLGLWDTAGQEDFATLRPLSYPNADVFLVFFSTVNPTSAQNVKSKWMKEIKEHCPDVPFYLIGSQIDLRTDEKIIQTLENKHQKVITTKAGHKFAKELGAEGYLEISAKEEKNYRTVFDTVLRFVINVRKQQKTTGRVCWSIHCREKLSMVSKVKCSGDCDQSYCHDCIEIWDDGFKGCPQCIAHEKERREAEGKGFKVKKPRISPQDKLFGTIAEVKAAYEETLQRQREALAEAGNESASNTTPSSANTPRDHHK